MADKYKDSMITSGGAGISGFSLQPPVFCKAPSRLLSFLTAQKCMAEIEARGSLLQKAPLYFDCTVKNICLEKKEEIKYQSSFWWLPKTSFKKVMCHLMSRNKILNLNTKKVTLEMKSHHFKVCA